MIRVIMTMRAHIQKVGLALLGLALLGTTACRTQKKLPPKEPVAKITLPELKPEEYLAQRIDYRTFSGKASVHMEQKGEQQDFSANIRMQKDKTVWASAIALGIAEVARALVTPDSLQAIVRITKKSYVMPYEEGLALIQAEVPFPALQNLLIGNPLINDVPLTATTDQDSVLILSMTKDEFVQVLTFDKEKRTLRQLELTSHTRPFKCTIQYSRYGPVALQQPFAFDRSILIENKGEKVKLNFEFSKAELDVPVEFPFSIPASYERAQVKKKGQ